MRKKHQNNYQMLISKFSRLPRIHQILITIISAVTV
ncbi:OapA N-terminal domain-containing protein, partial [Photobacterium halotolerans]